MGLDSTAETIATHLTRREIYFNPGKTYRYINAETDISHAPESNHSTLHEMTLKNTEKETCLCIETANYQINLTISTLIVTAQHHLNHNPTPTQQKVG